MSSADKPIFGLFLCFFPCKLSHIAHASAVSDLPYLAGVFSRRWLGGRLFSASLLTLSLVSFSSITFSSKSLLPVNPSKVWSHVGCCLFITC